MDTGIIWVNLTEVSRRTFYKKSWGILSSSPSWYKQISYSPFLFVSWVEISEYTLIIILSAKIEFLTCWATLSITWSHFSSAAPHRTNRAASWRAGAPRTPGQSPRMSCPGSPAGRCRWRPGQRHRHSRRGRRGRTDRSCPGDHWMSWWPGTSRSWRWCWRCLMCMWMLMRRSQPNHLQSQNFMLLIK